jgi:hypothetical protein
VVLDWWVDYKPDASANKLNSVSCKRMKDMASQRRRTALSFIARWKSLSASILGVEL